ncbi:hypothetical protein R3I93_002520 [Phoxinus phoxinus]|uniref:Uncharacterized protein n=1 Tax=Phoxinus phoxinus TaxID=58324 RepID=A0AAN9HHF7_9TELE
MTERMSERLFPKIKEQIKFMSALEDLKSHHDISEHEISQTTLVVPHSSTAVRYPPFLMSALEKEDPQLKAPTKNKFKNALIQALFDHLSQKTMYPSHTQYVDLMRSVLMSFPFLREKYGSGFDALLESLRNKFKKERKPLVHLDEVARMKEKYSSSIAGCKRASTNDEEPVCSKTKMPASDNFEDDGEDEHSIAQHVKCMQMESRKLRPNLDLIRQRLKRTKKYRAEYISQHSTKEVLCQFPCLRRPIFLLEEMNNSTHIDIDKCVLSNLRKLSPQLVEKAPNTDLKQMLKRTLALCETEVERNGQMVNAAILLLPSLFKEKESALYVINQDPPHPTPAIVLKDCENGNPLTSGSISIRMDGEDMVEDDGGIDISLAVSLLYSMYQIYNVAYPKYLRKTMAFLEAFVFKRSGPVPICVKRVYNSL